MSDREKTERLGLTTLDIADVPFGYGERVEFSQVWRDNANILDRVALGSTTGSLSYYVAANGSDAAAGTSDDPLLTIQEAVNRVPKFVRHPVVITVGSGSFAGSQMSGFFFQADAPISGAYVLLQGTLVPVVPATGPSSGTVATATAGFSTTISWGYLTASNSPGWTTDDLASQLIVITSGTGAGQVRVVKGNDSNIVRIVGGWSPNLDSTSAFSFMQPATYIVQSSASLMPNDVDTSGTNNGSTRLFNVSRLGSNPEDEAVPSNFVIQRMALSGSDANCRFFSVNDAVLTVRQCKSISNNLVYGGASNAMIFSSDNVFSGSNVRQMNPGSPVVMIAQRNYCQNISSQLYTPAGASGLKVYSRAEMLILSGNTSSLIQGGWGTIFELDATGTWVSGSTLGTATGVFRMNSTSNPVSNNVNVRFSSCRVDNVNTVVEIFGPGNFFCGTLVGSGSTNLATLTKGAQLSFVSTTAPDTVNGVTIDGSSAITLAGIRALTPTVTGSLAFGTRAYQCP